MVKKSQGINTSKCRFYVVKNIKITTSIDGTINMYTNLSKSDLVRSENTQIASVIIQANIFVYLLPMKLDDLQPARVK